MNVESVVFYGGTIIYMPLRKELEMEEMKAAPKKFKTYGQGA